MSTKLTQRELMSRCKEELERLGPSHMTEMTLNVPTALMTAVNLQHAMEHPASDERLQQAADFVIGKIVEGLEKAGFTFTAESIRRGGEGPECRVCGCTELNACPGGCSWVEEDLCSRCKNLRI